MSLRRALAFAFTPRWLLPFLAACAAAAPPEAPLPPPRTQPTASSAAAKAPPVELTLIGTADLHGRLATLPLLGGYLSAIRAKNPGGVVLVDAGDMFQGTLESNSNEGAAVIDAYKALGYDAVAIGNHELDYGPVGPASTVHRNAAPGPDSDPRGAIKARAAQALGAFPVLSANLLEDNHPPTWPNVAPSALLTRRGVSIGLIGVTTMGTLKSSIAANVIGVQVTPLADAIAAQAQALRAKGAQLVIVAAHAGGECAKNDAPADLASCDPAAEIFEVARKLPAGAVQAIVAGHTHKSIAHVVAGIPIVQSGAYGTAFGRVDFTIDPATGTVVATRIHPPEPVSAGGLYEGVATVASPGVELAIAPAIEGARARRAESLGVTLTGPFPAKYRDESALGDLVASLLLRVDPAMDVAVTNGGGLRADLATGPLTYGSLYDALPFENRLARVTMTGKLLRDALQHNLTSKSGILSIAGARVEGRCAAGKLALDVVLTREKKPERKLRDDDRVRIITNEFVATGGDDFTAGDRIEIDEDGPAFREPLAALLRKQGGALKPEEWLVPGKPRIRLPGPLGPTICGP